MAMLPLGINGVTGDYAPPLEEGCTLQDLLDQPAGPKVSRKRQLWLDIDTRNLALTGWGVVFAAEDPDAAAIREALCPLLCWRKQLAGDLYKECFGDKGYRRGEDKLDFLQRHKVGPGPVDPKIFPYYVLLVGSPEAIPYDFQYKLDFQYAVGRIHFDKIEDYGRYARAVVAAEQSPRPLPYRATLLGTRQDPLTERSVTELLEPVVKDLKEHCPKWKIETLTGADATKSHLASRLQDDDGADVLFTAGHGLFFPYGHCMQRDFQGALLCQDWPGHDVSPTRDHYFCAEDISGGGRKRPLITFHFACFSAGSPTFDDFIHLEKGTAPERRAEEAFVSRLMQRLLAEGVALAAVGHVEGAWWQSFAWGEAGPQIKAFSSALIRVLWGEPVGAAMESLNERFGELAMEVAGEGEPGEGLTRLPTEKVQDLWVACHDARNYVVVGDPAVRIGAIS
jgi:hypothetical protein